MKAKMINIRLSKTTILTIKTTSMHSPIKKSQVMVMTRRMMNANQNFMLTLMWLTSVFSELSFMREIQLNPLWLILSRDALSMTS